MKDKTKVIIKRQINKSRPGIYEHYRQVLEMPDLSDKQIDEIREGIIPIARLICEHVWGKKFY